VSISNFLQGQGYFAPMNLLFCPPPKITEYPY
jgi:hypothetical protein